MGPLRPSAKESAQDPKLGSTLQKERAQHCSVDGGRACAGHPHGLGLAAGTGWQGPYIQLVLQSCRDRKWARSRLASGVGRLYVRPVPLDRAEGVGIAKLPIGELINLSYPMGNLVAHITTPERT